MAQKGDNANNAAPDFKGAAAILKGGIANADSAKSKAQGDLSAEWKKVEDNCHVNKAGAKFVKNLLGKGPATASDTLRTVIGLCNTLDIGITRDMVDMAEGKEVLTIKVIDTPSVDV